MLQTGSFPSLKAFPLPVDIVVINNLYRTNWKKTGGKKEKLIPVVWMAQSTFLTR